VRVHFVKTDSIKGGFAMSMQRRGTRTWTLCFSCGSAVPPESLWIDDELLCRECAFRLMLDRIKQSDFADRECVDERSP
jgi:DNA-directed RNA polymerase subunit RPC12/RpoP